MKPTVEAVLLEFGISFPIRNEITVAKALVKARAERDDLTRERDAAREDAARKDAITRESAIAALVEMGAIEWTHASVSQPFVDGGFDVRYAKHVIILPDAALTQEDA